MTLEEAIRIKEEDIRYIGEGSVPNIVKAERLGIKALKVVKQSREQQGLWILPNLMSGETKE